MDANAKFNGQPVPKGWTLVDEGDTMPLYITQDAQTLGEYGCVGLADGGYLLPGAGEAWQGPYETLAQALAVAYEMNIA